MGKIAEALSREITTGNVVAVGTSTLTMSSREISELTGKNHGNVLRDIRNLLTDLYELKDDSELNHKQIQGITVTRDNRSYIESISLDKNHTLTLLSGYDAKARMRIIKRWQELEAKVVKTPATYLDALKALVESETQKQLLLERNKDLATKVDDLQVELDESMEWLTIKKIAQYNDVLWSTIKWRPLKAYGIKSGKIPHKIFDANFPEGVNVYHIDTWRAVYPKLILPRDEQ